MSDGVRKSEELTRLAVEISRSLGVLYVPTVAQIMALLREPSLDKQGGRATSDNRED